MNDCNYRPPMPGSTHASGTSTPTRSCLKHSQHHQHTLDAACCSTRKRPGVKPQQVTKTVSFDGHEPQHIYLADYDYDRQSVPIAAKLSYEDLLELKKLKIHLLCPRNHKNCNIVPVGILPLLPSSNPPSPASSVPSTLPHIHSPPNPSCTDDICDNHHVHPTPPTSSSDEDHSDSLPSSPLVFRSSLDKTDPADPASPSTPTRKRSLSPLRVRKVAQHTSPSQPLARDVPAASERLAALCAPTVNNTLALSSFQMGPSTHRSASGVESDSDSDSDQDRDRHHHHHHQYALSKRDARKPPNRDEQISGGDPDADADADASDDDVAVVPPPFAPPPCLFIQPSAALTSQTVMSFSLAQPVPSARPTLAPPKMPLLPFMPLLPTPPTSSPTSPSQSNTSSPRCQSPMGAPSLIPMQVPLPPLGLAGVPSPGLIPPSPFSLYPAEAMNSNLGRTSSGSNSSLVPKEKACVVAAAGMSTETGAENPYLRWGRC